MTERIDHAAEARMHIDWAHEHQEHEGITERTVTDTALLAQVHATLALVEQQRIQNLIALADKFDQPQAIDAILNRTPPNGDKGWVHHGVQPEIAAALGIEEVRS